MEMCNIMEEGIQRARNLAEQAAKAYAAGNAMEGLQMTTLSNGLMLFVICHGLFAHDDEIEDLWKGLFTGPGQVPDA